MKKFYMWSIALIAVILTSFSASAFTISVDWNEAGTVKLYKGSVAPANELDIAGKTNLSIESESSFYLYVLPTEGYVFESITEFSGNVKTSFSSNQSYGGQFYSAGMVSSTRDGQTLSIKTKKLDRSASMSVNVINGAENIGGYVTGLYQPLNFSNGENSLKFAPDYETGLYINCVNVSEFYSIKLNGTPVEKNKYWARYEISGIKNGDNLEIQVFEGEPVKTTVTATLSYADGLEGCLNSIRNWSLSQFVTPVDNKIEATKGQDIAFNFFSVNQGYNITDVLINGQSAKENENIKYTSTDDNVQVRFTIEEDVTVAVQGSGATYSQIAMTAYVMNPEGVVIKAGTYTEGTPVDFANATAITDNITLPTQTHTDTEGNVTYITPSFTLTPENAKKVSFTVDDRKYYNAYISPADGWYIATVQDSSKAEIAYADKEENTTFYVVALPLPNNNTATINVNLSSDLFENVVFKSNTTLANNWSNPDSNYSLTNNGATNIKFTDGYQTPFTLASRMVVAGINCELDGRVLAAADAETAISYPLDLVNGSVANVSSTNYAANASLVTLTKAGGQTATYTYGTLKRAGENGYNLLNGTSISVTPGSDKCMLTVDGKVVYSPLNDINELTDGAYTFTLTKATEIAASADAAFIKITKTNPLEGQLVSELESFTVYLPVLDSNMEKMLVPDESMLGSVKITDASGKTIQASAIGDPGQTFDSSWNPNGIYYPIEFETIDEPGKYTVTIPAGFFYEAGFNEDYTAMVRVEGGATTAAYTGTFTIDPDAPDFHLIPAQNSEVTNLSTFKVVFPNATMVEKAEDLDIETVTLTGEGFSSSATTVSVATGTDYPTIEIYFAKTPSEGGEYTLTLPASAFSIDGWKESQAYSAVYNYIPAYELTPKSGSTIEELTFTITFPAAKQVTFSGSQFDFSLSQGETYATPRMDVTEVSGAEVPTFTISIPADVQKAPFGLITLSISEGAFSIDGTDSPYISATYTYEGTVESSYNIDPNGSKILIPAEEWGTVMWTFIFDEASKVQGVDGAISGAEVTVNGKAAEYMAMAESNMLMMALMDKSNCKDGDVLHVHIPAGAFTLSGEESPEIDNTWTLVEAKTYTWTISPASNTKVGEINKITITFEGATSVSVNEDSHYVDVKQGYTVAGKMDMTAENNVLTLTAVAPMTQSGTYTMQISPYQLTIDEVQTLDNWLQLTYTIDPTLGITDVTINGSEKVTAVTVNGRVIPAANTKTLPAGIYIINGKKTLIK